MISSNHQYKIESENDNIMLIIYTEMVNLKKFKINIYQNSEGNNRLKW